jgi:hypothetical protein
MECAEIATENSSAMITQSRPCKSAAFIIHSINPTKMKTPLATNPRNDGRMIMTLPIAFILFLT